MLPRKVLLYRVINYLHERTQHGEVIEIGAWEIPPEVLWPDPPRRKANRRSSIVPSTKEMARIIMIIDRNIHGLELDRLGPRYENRWRVRRVVKREAQ